MGLGAYLAAVTDRDRLIAEEEREMANIVGGADDKKKDILRVLGRYGIGPSTCELIVRDLERNPGSWVQVRAKGLYRMLEPLLLTSL